MLQTTDAGEDPQAVWIEALTSEHLRRGFAFEGERVPLINPQRGIFKPRLMDRLLSFRTLFPRSGARIWYDYQRRGHAQLYSRRETVECAFMGNDADAADNRWLREAYEDQTPVIYFLGVAPGQYQAVLPVFIAGWDARALRAELAFGEASHITESPQTEAERRYGLRQVKQRLDQAQFRTAAISAYGGRFALSRLPEARLLDAAQTVADADEAPGQPVVPHGSVACVPHDGTTPSSVNGVAKNLSIAAHNQATSVERVA